MCFCSYVFPISYRIELKTLLKKHTKRACNVSSPVKPKTSTIINGARSINAYDCDCAVRWGNGNIQTVPTTYIDSGRPPAPVVNQSMDNDQSPTATWQSEHHQLYERATRHPFILSIRNGAVDFSSFKRWLVISLSLSLALRIFSFDFRESIFVVATLERLIS